MNRIEVQDKGKGCGRNPNTGKSDGKGASDKGIRTDIRKAKHTEAVSRNCTTPPTRRRAYWKAQGFSRQSDAIRALAAGVSVGVNF